jgi:predicted dehydrogenase
MAETRRPLRVGLIGTGFMGKTHTFGFAAAARVFELPFAVEIVAVADRSDDLAARAAAAMGIPRSTGDWTTLIADKTIDVIDITAPNAFHRDMALAAVAAGKHVYCEKPLAPRAADATAMADAAEAKGVKTQVGFNYICNPLMRLAREMIAGGELGEIRSYRGIHAEDYMADATAPFSFRNDPVGGGVLADLGSHALATAEFLLGPIARVLGDAVTIVTSRPDGSGGTRPVVTDDITRAFLRFDNGASGSIEASSTTSKSTAPRAR